MLVVFLFFKPPKREADTSTLKQKILRFDIVGTALLIGGVCSLLLALQWGGNQYPWSDSKVYGCLIGFGLITICFVIFESRLGDQATVPLRLFRNRTVWSASLLSGFLVMSMYEYVGTIRKPRPDSYHAHFDTVTYTTCRSTSKW